MNLLLPCDCSNLPALATEECRKERGSDHRGGVLFHVAGCCSQFLTAEMVFCFMQPTAVHDLLFCFVPPDAACQRGECSLQGFQCFR